MHPLGKVQPVNCLIVHAIVYASEIADVNGALGCRPIGFDFRVFQPHKERTKQSLNEVIRFK